MFYWLLSGQPPFLSN